MKNNMVFGLAGKAGSGKDTVADIIQDICKQNGKPIERYAFATPLKEFCQELFRFSRPETHDAKLKEEYFYNMYYAKKFRNSFDSCISKILQKYIDAVDYSLEEFAQELEYSSYQSFLDSAYKHMFNILDGDLKYVPSNSYRSILSWFGLQDRYVVLSSTPRFVLQKMGTEFFREFIDEDFWTEIAPKENVVYTDVRFENENDFVHHEVGGVIVLISRNSTTTSQTNHKSESLEGIHPDYLITNNGSIDELVKNVRTMIGVFNHE